MDDSFLVDLSKQAHKEAAEGLAVFLSRFINGTHNILAGGLEFNYLMFLDFVPVLKKVSRKINEDKQDQRQIIPPSLRHIIPEDLTPEEMEFIFMAYIEALKMVHENKKKRQDA